MVWEHGHGQGSVSPCMQAEQCLRGVLRFDTASVLPAFRSLKSSQRSMRGPVQLTQSPMRAQDLAEQLKETSDVVLPLLAPTSGGQGSEPVLAALEAAGLPCVAAPADALALSDRSR